MPRPLASFATALLSLTAVAPAQADRSPFAPAPFALSLDAQNELPGPRIKASHDQPGNFPAYYTHDPNGPAQQFAPADLFPASLVNLIEIDAMSSGNDFVPVDHTGNVSLGSNPQISGGWAAILFALANGSTGQDNSLVQLRSNALNGQVAGEVFAYFFEGSNNVPAAVQGQVQVSTSALHAGLATGQAIDAIDFQLAAMVEGNLQPDLFFVDVTDKFFFSITRGSANAINAAIAAGNTPAGWTAGTADPGHIYMITWSSVAWTSPIAIFTAGELLIPGKDLDALAMNAGTSVQGTPGAYDQGIIFSTAETSLNQLLFYRHNHTPTTPLKIAGTNVVDKIKLKPSDNVVAVCGSDPDSGLYGRYFCTPVDLNDPLPLHLGVTPAHTPSDTSAFATAPYDYAVQVSGWGSKPPRSGLMTIMATDGVTVMPVASGWRNATDDSMDITVQLPPLAGVDILFRAVFDDGVKPENSYGAVIKAH